MKTRNVITDNCEKIRPEYQPATVRFDYTKGSQATVTTKKTQCLFGNSLKKYLALDCFSCLNNLIKCVCSRENGILNDVTLTSSLRSLVQVVMAPFMAP